MKKAILGFQLLVVMVFAAKIALVGLVNQELHVDAESIFSVAQARAESPKTLPAMQAETLSMADEKNFESLLEERKKTLDAKEEFLKIEEERLISLQSQIEEKLLAMGAAEKRLSQLIESRKTVDNEEFQKLAKVYESTPPAKAGSMLEKLDSRTAAGISMNMKRDKAGAIWGYISPQKAVEITREITRSQNTAQ
jgi:flagellar motility protein MotE (MotC chaperone)